MASSETQPIPGKEPAPGAATRRGAARRVRERSGGVRRAGDPAAAARAIRAADRQPGAASAAALTGGRYVARGRTFLGPEVLAITENCWRLALHAAGARTTTGAPTNEETAAIFVSASRTGQTRCPARRLHAAAAAAAARADAAAAAAAARADAADVPKN